MSQTPRLSPEHLRDIRIAEAAAAQVVSLRQRADLLAERGYGEQSHQADEEATALATDVLAFAQYRDVPLAHVPEVVVAR